MSSVIDGICQAQCLAIAVPAASWMLQIRGPAAGKLRSPKRVRVLGTMHVSTVHVGSDSVAVGLMASVRIVETIRMNRCLRFRHRNSKYVLEYLQLG